MANQGQLIQKVNGVDKTYFFHDLGIITRMIHAINGVNSFYYYPQNNVLVPIWLDLGGGGVANPWDDAQSWNE